jgi:hypothetical protein
MPRATYPTIDPPNGLMRQCRSNVTIWTRSFHPRSFRNLYAVKVVREMDSVVKRVRRVHGVLCHGKTFKSFLLPSLGRKHSLCELNSDTREWWGHWVIVKAESAQAAESHEDVLFIEQQLTYAEWHSRFCGVYFISNGNNAVKIGQTTSPLKQRLTTIQLGSPSRVYVVAVIASSDLKRLEREIHKTLRHKRLSGEWFSMSDDEAVRLAESLGGAACTVSPFRSLSGSSVIS